VPVIHVCQGMVLTDICLSFFHIVIQSLMKQPVSISINCTAKLGSKSVRLNI
jgi:hypothetical protein